MILLGDSILRWVEQCRFSIFVGNGLIRATDPSSLTTKTRPATAVANRTVYDVNTSQWSILRKRICLVCGPKPQRIASFHPWNKME